MLRPLRSLLAIGFLALSPAAAAAPCIAGSLFDYIALAMGCEIGAIQFTGFQAFADLPEDAVPIAPADIDVTPVNSATNPGFTFDVDAAATSGAILSALFSFQVIGGPGAALIGAQAILSGTFTGDGAAILVEDLCLDGLFAMPLINCSSANTANLINLIDANVSFTDESTSFDPVQLLDVFANPIIDAGLSGTASIVSATLLFATNVSAVSEPSAPALVLLAGALALFAFRRRSPHGGKSI